MIISTKTILKTLMMAGARSIYAETSQTQNAVYMSQASNEYFTIAFKLL